MIETPLNIQDQVELMKSVRASGTLLDAGLRGDVLYLDTAEDCQVRFEGLDRVFVIKSKYLRKCSDFAVDLGPSA